MIVVGALDKESPLDSYSLNILETHPRIHWLGFQKDIRPALNISQVFILPSYREGFPNVLLQAGAMELPSIATDVSGSNELITHEFNGWLVPVKDDEALAAAMLKSINCSHETLYGMGLASRDRVVKRFERNAHLKRMLCFYRSLQRSKSETFV